MVHGGMNHSGSLAKFTLHATHCGSFRHEPPENEIHFLSTMYGSEMNIINVKVPPIGSPIEKKLFLV